MRLINVHTLEARDFSDHLPSYAILSYDWAQHYDNIFNVGEHIASQYPHRGSTLLRAFCDFIKNGNQRLAAEPDSKRIDWCYIHESHVVKSTFELPGAVERSYETCTCCVVYLMDLARHGSTSAGDHSKHSRRLRHGAVLQELMIPPSLVLCNIEWYVLPVMDPGDDSALVSDLTGIPEWRLQRKRSVQMFKGDTAAEG